jgi:hypothetical protein
MTLNDTQRMVLVTAAGRDDGQLYPLGRKLSAKRRDDAIRDLLDAELIIKVPASSDDQLWREEQGERFGLAITPDGRDLLAAEEDGVSVASLPAPDDLKPGVTNSGSKIARVVVLLQRDGGATLAELSQATDWLPHSVRAALTGLKKKGHAIERGRRDDVTFYFARQEG